MKKFLLMLALAGMAFTSAFAQQSHRSDQDRQDSRQGRTDSRHSSRYHKHRRHHHRHVGNDQRN